MEFRLTLGEALPRFALLSGRLLSRSLLSLAKLSLAERIVAKPPAERPDRSTDTALNLS
jgi:hypothetical protein